MKMDKLEKYIISNKEQIDDKRPSDKVWHKINDRLDQSDSKNFQIGNYLWRAAAVILFATVLWLLYDRNGQDMNVADNNETYENNIVFNDVESHYINMIESKQELILQYVSNNPEIDKNLLTEIDQLDSTYHELKSNLDDGYSERIIDAMVVNLQMRIDILNRQLDVLEKIKKIKEDETTNISI
jgi:hypothetical protein